MSSKREEKEKQNSVKISFICLNREKHFSYLKQKDMILKAISNNPYFNKRGQIWQTLERGVNYPVLHYMPSIEANNDIEMNIIDGQLTSFSVLYEELERIELPVIVPHSTISAHNSPSSASLSTGRTNQPKCAHIFVGFKTLDKTFNAVLEENWKDWTGARNLYLNLSSDFGLSKICFYRKKFSNDFNAFMYILIADCTHINDKNRVLLLDFVDRFRLQRLCGYLTVYTNISEDHNICANSSLTPSCSDSGVSSNMSDSIHQNNDENCSSVLTSIEI